ncbi:Ribonucleases P/MRP protein subunit POP7 [Madurella mycetomatis]|uniref:Ribonucleases P/MRP protein subunit POP7 n=1 Tax=Madurella mycetomatis TaxID=100816 RepID=A0A175WFR7_9PEZI|nr:Ribonucleases P/MRP protein subunit POP7 [Madurella mycetomatis]
MPRESRGRKAVGGMTLGSRIQKRPLPGPSLAFKATNTLPTTAPAADSDGYIPPPRAAHTAIIKVSASASFMSLVKRARKALENGPQKTKGLPLTARMAALETRKSGKSEAAGSEGFIEDALDDVVLIATGKAIQKVIEIGCFFQREKELIVSTRTRTLQAIDDVVMQDEDAEEEDQVRVRNVSCIEVGIRWAP